MMSLMPLLTMAAVPFEVEMSSDHNSILARRQRSRLLRNQFELERQIAQEACNALAQAMAPPAALGAGTGAGTGAVPAPPPNSPNNVSNSREMFDFEQNDSNENVNLAPNNHNEEVQEQENVETNGKSGKESRRKRRRLPSFKRHRVIVKKGLFEDEAHLADDEMSDDEELRLRLELIAHTRNNFNEHRSNNNNNRVGNNNGNRGAWAKIGSDLRLIADRFQQDALIEESTADNLSELSSDTLDANSSMDTLSTSNTTEWALIMLNQLLPFALPRSLWSALFSYAAWKLLKRFQ